MFKNYQKSWKIWAMQQILSIIATQKRVLKKNVFFFRFWKQKYFEIFSILKKNIWKFDFFDFGKTNLKHFFLFPFQKYFWSEFQGNLILSIMSTLKLMFVIFAKSSFPGLLYRIMWNSAKSQKILLKCWF